MPSTPNPLQLVGNNIKSIRKESGIKGDTLARELGKTRAAVSQIENGLIDVKLTTLYRIAEILGTDVINLVRSSEETVITKASATYNQYFIIDSAVVNALLKSKEGAGLITDFNSLNQRLKSMYNTNTVFESEK